jgi:hypothetical protein
MAGINSTPIGRQAPTLNDLNKYTAYLKNAKEVIWQPLYDYQTYAALGQLSLNFFQVANGQGTKSYADTNMEMNGQLPAGMNFLCVGIEVKFFPGGAIEAVAANNFADDTYTVSKSGFAEFSMLQKNYLREAPIGVFPDSNGLIGFGATNLAAATDGCLINYAVNTGPIYQVTPIRIPSSQNFLFKMSWPTLVPISVAGRVGVRLLGYTYRNAQ